MRDGAVAPPAVHTASVQQVQKASDKNNNPIYYHDVMHSLPDSHFVWVSYDGGVSFFISGHMTQTQSVNLQIFI